jgi:hypothetical protein
MVAKFIKLKGAIQHFLMFLKSVNGKREFSKKKLPDLVEEEWALLSGLCIILKLFKNVTENLSGEKYSTFSHALPLLRILKNFLFDQELFHEDVIRQKLSHAELLPYTNEDFSVSCALSEVMPENNFESFTRRFTGMDFSVLWITYLDPRCRKMKHLSESERMNAKSCFIDEMVEICFAANRETQTNKGNDQAESKEDGEYKDDDCFGVIFDSPLKHGRQFLQAFPEADSFHDDLRNRVELKVVNYLNKMAHISHHQDPLLWWRENKHLYPNIAQTARKWLCIPATSTPSERVFSNCGVAVTAKRSKMKGSCLKSQILLKNNMHSVSLIIDNILNTL